MKLTTFFTSSVISVALSSALGNPLNGTYADKVRIQSTTGEQLQFFEVQAFSGNTNVAVQGSCTQSSTFKNDGRFAASMANDAQDWTFSHTDDPDPSWELELDEAVPLERITILNRYCKSREDSPGCLCRLSFATVTLFLENEAVSTRSLGNTCGVPVVTESFLKTAAPMTPSPTSSPITNAPSSASLRTSSPVTSSPISASPPSSSPTTNDNVSDGMYADKIQIQSTTGEQLQFFEVQAFSANTNVAIQGSCTQSSTFKNDGRFAASMANDAQDWTFSHTDDPSPSWELELDEAVPLERITILNRYCKSREDSPGCLCRLSFATVTLILENETVSTRSLGNTCGVPVVTESFLETAAPKLSLPTSSPSPTTSISVSPSSASTSSTNTPSSTSPTTFSPTSSSPISASPSRFLISSFSSMDIGNVGLRGSAASKFTVTGSGGDIWGSSDQFHYYYQEIPSDANIRIEMLVEDLTSDQHEWTKGGLMLRNNLGNDSIHYSAFTTGRMGLAYQWRPCNGCNSNHNGLQGFSDRKVWFRIDKFASYFEAYYRRLNESEWTRFGLTALNFSGTSYYVGVAVSSHDNSRTASLVGSSLKITTIAERVLTNIPTFFPSYFPTAWPTFFPTISTEQPTDLPTEFPTAWPTFFPTE